VLQVTEASPNGRDTESVILTKSDDSQIVRAALVAHLAKASSQDYRDRVLGWFDRKMRREETHSEFTLGNGKFQDTWEFSLESSDITV
jgi:hypothetical protein